MIGLNRAFDVRVLILTLPLRDDSFVMWTRVGEGVGALMHGISLLGCRIRTVLIQEVFLTD